MDSEIAHLRNMLKIHRRNRAHYLMQAKAYGGIDLAPPITRYGLEEADREIAQLVKKLKEYGEEAE